MKVTFGEALDRRDEAGRCSQTTRFISAVSIALRPRLCLW
jgi:hypothetical protein